MKKELSLELMRMAESTEKFPWDFDRAWRWIGYSRKDAAKRVLLENFKSDTGYSSLHRIVEREIGATTKEEIRLTTDCFKKFCMMAGTEKGKEVRDYYLECERRLKAIQSASMPSVEQRAKSKVVRNCFTDVCRDHGVTKRHEHIQITRVTKVGLGLDARKKKDAMNAIELHMITASESISAARILQQHPNGYYEVKPIVGQVAEGVAALTAPPLQIAS